MLRHVETPVVGGNFSDSVHYKQIWCVRKFIRNAAVAT